MLQKQGHLDDAIIEYRKVSQAKPDDVETHSKLGALL